ncbi:hypothetical protein PBI_SCTP2_346 [Salicola phage SCTP-2]|nr:hypothetical protein PBI_SCTP2_346 [Salicola phage SCTP-2]
MTYEFWKRVRDYAQRKMKQEYGHGDLKCPNCKRWTYELGGCVTMYQYDKHNDIMVCKQCGYESMWFMGAAVPISNNNYEYPTKDTDPH